MIHSGSLNVDVISYPLVTSTGTLITGSENIGVIDYKKLNNNGWYKSKDCITIYHIFVMK